MTEMVANLYDQDFYAWLRENAERIRQGRFSEVDVEHIAEELECMGRSEKRAFINRFAVLLAHLLKWQFQPIKRSMSWKYTIEEQRRKVQQLLQDSPSLGYELDDKLADAYEIAILKAAKETQVDKMSFPRNCPFSFEQAMNDAFWPE